MFKRLEKIKHPVIFNIILALLVSSCKNDGAMNEPNQVIPQTNYTGSSAMSVTTNDNGKLKIKSNITNQGEFYDITLNIEIRDQSGNPIPFVDVTYCQSNEKIILQISDPKQQYVSALFIGTPLELAQYFNGSIARNIPLEGKGRILQKPTIIPLLIGAIIFLAATTYAELSIIKNVYEINKFYLTDYVAEGNDYVIYCKTFDEIAEMIKSRYGIVTGLTSIFINFMTVGTSSASGTALQFTKSAASFTANKIRDALFAKAVDQWSVTMDELIGRKFAVRLYPYDTHNAFSNAKNLFAVMVIDFSDQHCQIQGNSISGKISQAVTGNSLSNVLVQLSGGASRNTYTDGSGDYSFSTLPTGNYTVSVSKSGYITDSKEVILSGTPVVANFVLSPTMPLNQYRMILQWGSNPSDLDAHLTGPLSDGSRFHMYYIYATQYQNDPYYVPNPWPSIVSIDKDDRYGNGFETITLYQQINGIYRFSVHDYTNRQFTDTYELSNSGAQITIYKGSTTIKKIDIPSNQGGTLWTAFELNGNTVTIINDMSYIFSPSDITKRYVNPDLELFRNILIKKR